MQQDWEALCDGDLDIEEKDSGSESSTDSNWLLRLTEHTAHIDLDDVHAGDSQADMVSGCSPVQSLVM